MGNLNTEDLAIVVTLLLTIAAAWLELINANPFFQALKFILLLVSLALAVHRIKTEKPFCKDIAPGAWARISDGYEVVVPRGEHRRGKNPRPRVLVARDNGFAEAIAELHVDGSGTVRCRASSPPPHAIRLDIRK